MGVRSLDRKLFAVIAIAITALTLGTMLGSGAGQVSLTENPTFSGHLLVEVETQDGIAVYEVHNVVTTIGKTHVLGYLENGTAGAENGIDWISLSDDASPDDTWEVLAGEYSDYGLTRAEGATIDVDATSYKIWKKFTCTADSKAMKCSGLHWVDTGSGNLWAAAAFTATTLNNGDNITITWTITHNGA